MSDSKSAKKHICAFLGTERGCIYIIKTRETLSVKVGIKKTELAAFVLIRGIREETGQELC